MSLALLRTYFILIHWMSCMLSGNSNWGEVWEKVGSNKQKAGNFSCVVFPPLLSLENSRAFPLVSFIFELSKNVLMVNSEKKKKNSIIC